MKLKMRRRIASLPKGLFRSDALRRQIGSEIADLLPVLISSTDTLPAITRSTRTMPTEQVVVKEKRKNA